MGRRNRPAQPGYRYRSPNQTNAEDLFPNLQEDVIASQRADTERIRKGLNTDQIQNPANRRRSQEAGGRATLRSLGRAGLMGAAFQGGKDIGEELERRVPAVGKAADALIEKSGVGALARRGAVSPGRVELTDEARQRLTDKDDSEDAARSRKMDYERERELHKGAERKGFAKGGMVSSASKRGDGIAQRGKTRCKVC